MGLAAIRRQHYCPIVPGQNGFEFSQTLHRVPVILVSDRTADEDIVRKLSAGAAEFVTIPFSPQVLALASELCCAAPAPALRPGPTSSSASLS